jgi:adenylate kinase
MRSNQSSLNKVKTELKVVPPYASSSVAQVEHRGPVLLLGAPGVGKGTQGDLLAHLWEVPKISTGDLLRSNVAEGTQMGSRASKIMKRGGLVPDELMMEMVAARLEDCDAAQGFIFDGFPRTIRQAEWFDAYLSVNQNGVSLGIVSMSMDLERLVQRVIHRRVCPMCKAVYNDELMPPNQAGLCDRDGSVLEQRNDDRLDVFKTRLDVFRRETEPLIRFYENHDLFLEIDAGKSSELVTQDIVSGLAACRRRVQMERTLSYSSRAS